MSHRNARCVIATSRLCVQHKRVLWTPLRRSELSDKHSGSFFFLCRCSQCCTTSQIPQARSTSLQMPKTTPRRPLYAQFSLAFHHIAHLIATPLFVAPCFFIKSTRLREHCAKHDIVATAPTGEATFSISPCDSQVSA